MHIKNYCHTQVWENRLTTHNNHPQCGSGKGCGWNISEGSFTEVQLRHINDRNSTP